MGNSASVAATMKVTEGGHVSVRLAKSHHGEADVSASHEATTGMATMPTFPCDYPMRVIRWSKFEALETLPRSDAAEAAGVIEALSPNDSGGNVILFISHSWWYRPAAEPPAPDYPSGARKDLKFQVISGGVRALIARESLDPARLCLWCDWFSIDQVDTAAKAKGVNSMIYYAMRSHYMLVPVPTPEVVNADYVDGADPDECAAFYPEDVADYGTRGWCRVEYFMFGLASEMRPGAAAQPLNLFAVGSGGSLQNFKFVEFLGGERQDMPSQGAFSFESDREQIQRLEDGMIAAFGHAVIENYAQSGERTIDLGAKMLRDEHLPTLDASIRAGKFRDTTTLSFNACPLLTTLPPLDGMTSLRTLSCVNAHGLERLPDLSSLPALEIVKLDNCHRLRSLPKLPPGVAWDDSHVPEHLAAEAAALLAQ